MKELGNTPTHVTPGQWVVILRRLDAVDDCVGDHGGLLLIGGPTIRFRLDQLRSSIEKAAGIRDR